MFRAQLKARGSGIFTQTKGLLTLISLLIVSPWANAETRPNVIAIVVDDMGHHLKRGQMLVDLPYPLTLSFLPGRQHTRALAEQAHLSGKEVMLHAPMETTHNYSLGFGALHSSMSRSQIQTTLAESLKSVPYMRGVNNHMGSALTQNTSAMTWVMETLSEHPYYFLDSKTSAKSVAAGVALNFGIPTLVRDVFLDHEQSEPYLNKQFGKLVALAKEKGSAIAIAHPHQVTIDFLEQALPSLGEHGISISTLSAIWSIRNPERHMFKDDRKAGASPSQLAQSSLNSQHRKLRHRASKLEL